MEIMNTHLLQMQELTKESYDEDWNLNSKQEIADEVARLQNKWMALQNSITKDLLEWMRLQSSINLCVYGELQELRNEIAELKAEIQ